jgi:hypothetical protein
MRLSIVALLAVLATPVLADAQTRTCTINRRVVTCSGIAVGTTPAEAAALLKPYETKIADIQILEGPPDGRNPWRFAAPSNTEWTQPRKKFGESPWWWSELYDPWWAEPWVAKPWQLEPRPEPRPEPFPERWYFEPRP